MKGILRPKTVLALITVFAIAGIMFTMMSENVYANKNPFSQSESNSPKLSTESLVTSSQPSQEKASQVISEITNKWKGKIKKEEWLHLVYQINSEIDNGVILPDGRPMPSSYTEEGWYYINKDGLVEKSVVTLKDETGNTLQQTVFNGSVETNLTFGFKTENIMPYELKLDRGFLQYVRDAEGLKIAIKHQDLQYKDKPHKEFSFTEVYDQPIQFNGENKEPVQSAYVTGLFASETDEMSLYRKVWKYGNGQDVLFEECELLLAESTTEAPLDVLTVLESAK
ncbi:MAG TPA: hypothetical protein VFR47_12505 [Anaerolineales bacterium]|nr:hypothetical protein [Anaerolineales bacterium]